MRLKFENPPARATYMRRYSAAQKRYLSTRKPDSKKVVKHEQIMQIELCKWISKTLPDVHYRSDTASGAFSSKWAKNTHDKQQSAKGLPDLTILAARHGFHGLLIELKPDGFDLKRKRNGTKIAVIRNERGKIIERDYKIRMKGDWKSLHIERQAMRIQELRAAGYCAVFGVGLNACKQIICKYFDIPYIENSELEF